MSQAEDKKYMRRAIELAKAGEGWVHPNPLVGAVIVKGGRIIGEGYHRKYGELHAERNAIAALTEKAEGATIYVTLEPCCHYGKTPPCTEAIMENKISRVVIGSRDPNPLVAGKGAKILREAGIEVEEDFLREECDALNPVFFHYISTKRPYVIMKYAMTADGKIATRTGASKWITGAEARKEVHRIRHACMGIMAGIGTVLADDPLLNCRLEDEELPDSRLKITTDGQLRIPAEGQLRITAEGQLKKTAEGQLRITTDGKVLKKSPGARQPVRIICDSHLRIPEDSQICRTAEEYETVIVCGSLSMEEDQERLRRLQSMGIQVVSLPGPDGRIDLNGLMEHLGQNGIDSILLEGGGGLNESALRAGIVSEVRAFIAPKIFGGQAKSPVEGMGVATPDQAVQMKLAETKMFGDDLMLRYVL